MTSFPFFLSNGNNSIVDNSGTWGKGGMFSALNRLSLHIEKVYEAAHAAGDLHMGDFHLIPLDGNCIFCNCMCFEIIWMMSILLPLMIGTFHIICLLYINA